MRPPWADSILCIFACMALSDATSNRPRPSPDWFDVITACQPAWFRRAIVSSALGRRLEQQLAHVRVYRLLGLLQDVADALVRGGQRRRFGQRCERAHRGQALRDIAQALRPQREHRVDLLRAVALLAQQPRETL